jgi:hypothetical protein
MDDGANGMSANASFSDLRTTENVVWLNRANGVAAIRDEAGYDGVGDYSCGNRFSGLGTSQSMDPPGTNLSSIGSAFVYNAGRGIQLAGNVGDATLTPDNALTENAANPMDVCDMENNSAVNVDARFNQWRNQSPLTCGTGSINSSNVQDHVNVALALEDPSTAFFPSNVILEGQTIRIRGSGFNAIDGNPPPTGCSLGDDPTQSCCLTAPAAANDCVVEDDQYVPIEGAGMCVQILPNAGTWNKMSVTAVTPTRMVTQIPYPVFGCKGEGDARVQVSKETSLGAVAKEEGFCTKPGTGKAVGFSDSWNRVLFVEDYL